MIVKITEEEKAQLSKVLSETKTMTLEQLKEWANTNPKELKLVIVLWLKVQVSMFQPIKEEGKEK